MSPSRRRFLKELAVGAAGAAMPRGVLGLRATERARRVLVVGAGPAGLTAAFELVRAGHDVAVFEARSRPGGRMHTLRDFDDGLHAEAGAMYLTSDNPGLEYAREFGLELVPVPFRADLGTVAHVAGVRVVQRAGLPHSWPVELREEDRGLNITQLQNKYHYAAIRGIEGLARLLEDGFPQEEFLQLDAISLAEYWRRNGASEAAMRLMRLRYFDTYGEGIETVSTLQIVRESASLVGATGAFQVKGGNDQICAALAARIPGRVAYDSPVVMVRQGGDGVRITIEQSGARQEVAGDYAIVTAPLQVLSKIAFTPPLSPLRATALREIRGTDVTRVFVQTRTRFWEAQGLDGSANTDLPIGTVYHATIAQHGTRGILESYTYGELARAMARLDSEQRGSTTRVAMEQAFPGLQAQAERGTSYSWGEDPWARGALTAFSPGQIGAFFHALQAPEGRVFFAGDAVGGVPGYSHAAFASGRRVAEQIAAL